jgi:hypothetical protein
MIKDKYQSQRVINYLKISRKNKQESLKERGNFIKRNRDHVDDNPAKSLVAHHSTHDKLRKKSYDLIKDKLKVSYK